MRSHRTIALVEPNDINFNTDITGTGNANDGVTGGVGFSSDGGVISPAAASSNVTCLAETRSRPGAGSGARPGNGPRPSAGRPGNGSKKRRKPVSYLRSGVYAKPKPIDPASPLGLILAERRRELIQDLGCEPSAAQSILIEQILTAQLHLAEVDAYLASIPLVDRRHRRLWPCVEARTRLSDSLVRQLSILGLKRHARKLDVAAQFAAEHERPGDFDGPEPPTAAPGVATHRRASLGVLRRLL